MVSLAELERGLLRDGELDRELLAVYGDALQAAGDPRGELIALDLAGVASAARRDVERRWLGEHAQIATSRFGFLHVAHDPRVITAAYDELFASPLMRYLGRLSVAGRGTAIQRILDAAVAGTRPYLTAVHVLSTGPATAPIAGPRLRRFVERTPNLRHVVVDGLPVFDGLVHPAVRRVTASGDALRGVAAPLVEHLEFTPRELPDLELFAPARWPGLRSLDLRAPFHGCYRLPLLAQLTHLRLREVLDVPEVQGALDRATALVELRVDRAHRFAPALRHPTARLVLPEPLPWPRRDTVERRAMSIDLPDGEIHVGLAETIDFLEAAALPPAAREAWRRWWDLVAELAANEDDDEPAAEFPAAVLERALAVDGLSRGWAYVRDQLRAATVPLDVVRVALYWA